LVLEGEKRRRGGFARVVPLPDRRKEKMQHNANYAEQESDGVPTEIITSSVFGKETSI